MDGWDWRDLVVTAAFACFATTALLRLMRAYREAVVRDVRRQLEGHQAEPTSSAKTPGE